MKKQFKVLDIIECVQEEYKKAPVNNILFIEAGDWISEGKTEDRETIIQDIETDKFYMIHEYRYGSPFTDWHYWHEDHMDDVMELVEVERKEVTTIAWKRVV